MVSGVSLMFSAGGQQVFIGKKNFSLDGQTRQVKSTSQPVNLPSAQPLMKPLWCTQQ